MELSSINIAGLLYAIATAAFLLIGLIYAFRSKALPYHIEALETPWEEIDPKFQFMFRALINGGGFFGISTGLFMLILLLIPFRAGEEWAAYAIGSIGLAGTLPLGYIVMSVKKNTAANPPFKLILNINLLLIAGLVITAST